jgi:hypothetical protein
MNIYFVLRNQSMGKGRKSLSLEKRQKALAA